MELNLANKTIGINWLQRIFCKHNVQVDIPNEQRKIVVVAMEKTLVGRMAKVGEKQGKNAYPLCHQFTRSKFPYVPKRKAKIFAHHLQKCTSTKSGAFNKNVQKYQALCKVFYSTHQDMANKFVHPSSPSSLYRRNYRSPFQCLKFDRSSGGGDFNGVGISFASLCYCCCVSN
jgi:hypothetical protein